MPRRELKRKASGQNAPPAKKQQSETRVEKPALTPSGETTLAIANNLYFISRTALRLATLSPEAAKPVIDLLDRLERDFARAVDRAEATTLPTPEREASRDATSDLSDVPDLDPLSEGEKEPAKPETAVGASATRQKRLPFFTGRALTHHTATNIPPTAAMLEGVPWTDPTFLATSGLKDKGWNAHQWTALNTLKQGSVKEGQNACKRCRKGERLKFVGCWRIQGKGCANCQFVGLACSG